MIKYTKKNQTIKNKKYIYMEKMINKYPEFLNYKKNNTNLKGCHDD